MMWMDSLRVVRLFSALGVLKLGKLRHQVFSIQQNYPMGPVAFKFIVSQQDNTQGVSRANIDLLKKTEEEHLKGGGSQREMQLYFLV